MTTCTRREALKAIGAGSAGAVLASSWLACSSKTAMPPVVLYTSADSFLLQSVTDAFTKATGFAVKAVTDTEATKTTGLVQRLVAESASPRADVWWSSEVLGTIGLAAQGLLAPSSPACAADFPNGWPSHLRDPQGLWWGFAQRARVIVTSSSRVPEDKRPRSLTDLASFEPGGRVAIAQPQFGTTRAHVAVIAAALGVGKARELLTALKSNARIYPGNSAVVRAVAEGEADVGLTDTDDVWVGQANGWKLDAHFGAMPDGAGALLIPNTVALVAHPGKQPTDGAKALLNFLCSAENERILAASESANFPVRTHLHAELEAKNPLLRFPVDAPPIDWHEVAAVRTDADSLIQSVFPL